MENKSPQELSSKEISLRIRQLEDILRENRTFEARELIEASLKEKAADSGQLYEKLSECYQREGQLEKALSSLQKAVEQGHITSDNFYRLAQLQQTLNQNKAKKETFSRLVGGIDKLLLADPLKEKSIAGAALVALWDLAALAATLPYWLPIASGQLLAKHLREKKVETYLQKAIESEPKEEYYLALLEQVKDKPRKVIKYARAALKHHPLKADFYAFLSNAYQKIGAKNDSQAYLLKALELKRDDGEFMGKYFFRRLEEKMKEEKNLEGQTLEIDLLDMLLFPNNHLCQSKSVLQLLYNYIKNPRYQLKKYANIVSRDDLVALRMEYWSGHFIEDVPFEEHPNKRLFGYVLEQRVKLEPENPELKYELAVTKILEAGISREGKAKDNRFLLEAISLFSDLKTQGYAIERGKYWHLTSRFFAYYGDKVEDTTMQKVVSIHNFLPPAKKCLPPPN